MKCDFSSLSRRLLLQGLAALPLAGLLASDPAQPALAGQGGEKHQLLVSGRQTSTGSYRVTAFDEAGELRLDLDLPARGHGLAASAARREAVIFARRPGTFALVLDLHRGAARSVITAAEGRHFFGHGVYSPDGKLLYASENDFEGERGVIGIYSADEDYRRVGEWDASGIGPHELCLAPDGSTLVIALGGILTHPDMPRMKLNIPEMEPALVFLDRRDGQLLRREKLPAELHLLSIRHLDVTADGTVAVGLQYQGAKSDQVPLVAMSRIGQSLHPLEAPAEVLRGMKNYCGSVVFEASGERFAVSSPRGSRVTFWSAEGGRYLSTLALEDGCGLAACQEMDSFMMSSGAAGLRRAAYTVSDHTARLVASPLDNVDMAQQSVWDNHMIAVSL